MTKLLTRRGFISAATASAATLAAPAVFAGTSTLVFSSNKTSEKMRVAINDAHGFNYVMRDLGTAGHPQRAMDRNLHVLIQFLAEALGADEAHITSGYRTQARQLKMLQRGQTDARNSYHPRGQAADLRLLRSGRMIPRQKVTALARSVGFGGVGDYRAKNFTHVDVREGTLYASEAFWRG